MTITTIYFYSHSEAVDLFNFYVSQGVKCLISTVGNQFKVIAWSEF